MNYSNGKIYKVVDNGYNKLYIGSTTQPLYKRMNYHRCNYRKFKKGQYGNTSVFEIFEEFGLENCKIELIENYQCNSRNELERKEGEHIRKNNCVNKVIAGRTEAERKIEDRDEILKKNREYHQKNKEQRNQQSKEYKERNREKMKEYAKKYRAEHKLHIQEMQRKYREKKKELKEQLNN